MDMETVKEKLQKATQYWQKGFDGDYSKGPALSVIALAIREADEAGDIKREELLPSERQMLNRILILAHCPICKPRMTDSINKEDI